VLREAGTPRALRNLRAMVTEPLELLDGLRGDPRPLIPLRLGTLQAYVVNDPAVAAEVLVHGNHDFGKGLGRSGSQPLRRGLGNGLLTSAGEEHLRNRRLLQPAFHRERVNGYAATMVALTERMLAGWRDGELRDLRVDLSALTLEVVCATMLGDDLDDALRAAVRDNVEAGLALSGRLVLPGSGLIERLPLPSSRRLLSTRARLDRVVYDLIARRRAQPDPGTDLLGLLIGALPDRQVRDEVVTILMAGHETTANALTWTWHLLAENPGVAADLRAELDTVLAGRPPAAGDMAALDLTGRVITESMRLYPPVWVTTRRLLHRRVLGGVEITPPALVLISPWLQHRHPGLFPNPERFDPARWIEPQAQRPRYAYLPFGAGPRQCIGNGFAMTEAVMVLATMAQRWCVRPLPGRVVVPQPLITLRPRDGLPARVHRRHRAPGEGPAQV
jgi:cytochrome P450